MRKFRWMFPLARHLSEEGVKKSNNKHSKYSLCKATKTRNHEDFTKVNILILLYFVVKKYWVPYLTMYFFTASERRLYLYFIGPDSLWKSGFPSAVPTQTDLIIQKAGPHFCLGSQMYGSPALKKWIRLLSAFRLKKRTEFIRQFFLDVIHPVIGNFFCKNRDDFVWNFFGLFPFGSHSLAYALKKFINTEFPGTPPVCSELQLLRLRLQGHRPIPFVSLRPVRNYRIS